MVGQVRVPDHLLVHQAIVETQVDTGPYGDQYGAPVTVTCFVDETRQLVRDASGSEVVSEATIICTLDQEPLFVVDSRVTLPSGRKAFVIMAKRQDAATLVAPSHLEVTL